MNEHDKCVKEMYQAMTLAGLLTMFIFAFAHTIFANAGEVLAFFTGTQVVLTYAVWSVIDWMENKKA